MAEGTAVGNAELERAGFWAQGGVGFFATQTLGVGREHQKGGIFSLQGPSSSRDEFALAMDEKSLALNICTPTDPW